MSTTDRDIDRLLTRAQRHTSNARSRLKCHRPGEARRSTQRADLLLQLARQARLVQAALLLELPTR